jgi:hypothetical protein
MKGLHQSSFFQTSTRRGQVLNSDRFEEFWIIGIQKLD